MGYFTISQPAKYSHHPLYDDMPISSKLGEYLEGYAHYFVNIENRFTWSLKIVWAESISLLGNKRRYIHEFYNLPFQRSAKRIVGMKSSSIYSH